MPPTPSVNTYNRLESLPFSSNFERSLRAEVRDPLWMLSRQWQMGEFEAEDIGSAILARIVYDVAPIDQYRPAHPLASVKAITTETPLEVVVERETPPMDLILRIEMGRHFFRMLHRAFNDPVKSDACIAKFRASTVSPKLTLTMPAEEQASAYLYSNRRLRQAAALIAAGNCIDGGRLYEYLCLSPTNKASQFLAAPDPVVDAIGVSFVAWFKKVFSQSTADEKPAYQDDSMEYKFAVTSQNTNGSPSILRIPDYAGGHLDWYNFDLDKNADAKLNYTNTTVAQARKPISLSVIPTDARFAGMPKPRWWEFEDGQVNLYGATADALNPATLIYNEFALMYSNDWMVVPLTLPLGNMVDVQQIVVTDSFGQRVKVVAAGSESPDDFKQWDLFSLQQTGKNVTGPDYRLLLPQVLDRVQEGKPFELVNFIRDEMANMVWAVEDIVADGLGGTLRGHEAGLQLLRYLETLPSAPLQPPSPNNAKIKYALSPKVPEHWIPFIPVHAPLNNREIRLQRSLLQREMNGVASRILPRTGIVSAAYPHYLNEEEVPRSGAIVSRCWQRTRWYNGQTYTWVGRQKQVGRGEGAIGSNFDQITEKK